MSSAAAAANRSLGLDRGLPFPLTDLAGASLESVEGTWNLGIGWTWKVFTVDLRYVDTNLSKSDCNAFTSDHTAVFNASGVTGINGGNLSNWCGSAFTARLSADLTVNTNLK